MMIPVRVFLGILLAALVASPAWSQERSGPPAALTESSAPHPMRIRVGASVAASQLVHVVQPADRDPNKMSAFVTGTVVLHAVIDFDGTVTKLEFVSGPALLTKPAMDAVKQWRYRPTTLNGQPVQVDTTINVVFAVDKKGNLKPQPKNP
jgi:outer membrane biosynthesis protein TonB